MLKPISQNVLSSVFFLVIITIMAARVEGQVFDLTYDLDEEVPPYSVVGNVGRDSNISQLLSAEDYATLRYRLLLYEGTSNNLFTIVNTTGVLETASRIDRETLCHYETTCKLTLHVAVQTVSGQQFYTFTINIMVKDINDNSPLFPLSTMTVKIDEDAAVSTSIPIAAAVDLDILNNTLQRYTLKTPSDTFGLKVTRNLDDSLIPQLFVKSLMDRETRPYYFLKVVALDGGSPRRSGELSINVTLNDVNDNPPRFSQQTYDVFVDEITPLSSRVMTLTATDEDIGQNGRVRFRLGARQAEAAFNTFRVIPESGNIVTVRELTTLQGKTMRLVVEAIDHGSKPQTAQAVVNIHVVDSINNAPSIRMTTPSGSRVSRVMENASPGFVVAHFIVEDDDSGDNGVVTCHLQDDTFGLQRLKEAEYKVTVYSALDRERVPFYDVTITCMDGGTPAMTTNVAFSVILEDANDNPPRFLNNLYRTNISENSENNYILRLEAEDIDLGQNGRVNYKLGNVTSLVSSYIHVNPTTGEMTTKQMLDHELFKQLDFQVVASDEGSPSLSSTAMVIIDVLDKNDNIPSVPSGYFLTVRENLPPGSVIGRINAIDPDEGPAGEVGYQLLTDNEATKLFNLSQSGEVRGLRSFDRESRDIYDINVLARDYGNNPQTNILHVRIKVTDDNDHRPVFEYPRPNNRTVFVTLDAKYNTTVAKILATDQDIGENSSLYYTIVDGARDVFEIEPRTGRMYTLRTLYSKDKGKYTITLFVRDNGVRPQSTSTTIIVVATQGNGTAAAATGIGSNDHIIIVAILVGVTVFIAIVVFLIVIRFLKKDRRDRRPKYSGALPMEVKKRSPTPEDDLSSDEGPWRRYDEAKRPNGPNATSGDVIYDANDDIIMFKLKLADQYRELEPEDKDSASSTLPRDTGSSQRNSVISDMDGAPDGNRDRTTTTRLATFGQGKPAMLQASGFGKNGDGKEKVWRTALKEKMADEILSSSSRETTGADSGRGPSEDGSQSRSSVTDDSGCLISPSHSILRGNTPKHQGSYSRSPSGSGYDRPPLLMTFQSTSPDHVTNGNGLMGGSSTYGTRKDHSINSGSYLSSVPSRQYNSYGKDYAKTIGCEKLQVGDKDITVHRNKSNTSPDKDGRNNDTTLKKYITGDDGYGSNGSNHEGNGGGNGVDRNKGNGPSNGLIRSAERPGQQMGRSRDARLCSEPPISMNGNKVAMSPYNKRGVQETGLAPLASQTSSVPLHINSNKPQFVRSADPQSSNKSKFTYPPSPSAFQNSTQSNNFKQTSCPQLSKDMKMVDPHSQSTLPSAYRSRSFNTNDLPFSVPSRSVQDMLNESLETQDDGNTTTTSGSYTIDHDELTLDLPQTDVFV